MKYETMERVFEWSWRLGLASAMAMPLAAIAARRGAVPEWTQYVFAGTWLVGCVLLRWSYTGRMRALFKRMERFRDELERKP